MAELENPTLNDIVTLLGQIESRLDRLQVDQQATIGHIKKIEDDAAACLAKLEVHDTRFANLETMARQTQTKVGDVASSLDASDARMDVLAAHLKSLTTDVRYISERIDRVGIPAE